MSNDDPSAETGTDRGPAAGDADDWLAEWVGLFDDTRDGGDEEAASTASPPEPAWPPPAERRGRRILASTVPPPEPAPAADGGSTPPESTAVHPSAGDAAADDPSAGDAADGPDEADQPAGGETAVVAESTEGLDGPPGERRPADDDDLAAIEAWQRAQERNRRQARVRAHQRAARQMQRQLPERGRTGLAAGPAAGYDGRGEPFSRFRLLGLGLVVLIAGLGGYLLFGPDGSSPASGPTAAVSETTPTDPMDGLGLTVGAEVAPATTEELALSTVQLVGLDDDLNPQCAGSGVIVTTDGTILTNAHVVRNDAECRFTTVGVGITVDSSSPPELLYRADVVLLRLGVDLAVLRISGPLDDDSGAPWPRSFPAAPLGDSDAVELGDEVEILGYPVIGGETITFTRGSVSGFTSQAGLGNRALIKTDASISAGNSGGLAVDAAGRVIGITTKARASEQGPAVDCRPVSDTNGDGLIGDGDSCVSVGGFLNGIRPINLSLPLLAAAGASDPVGGDPEVASPPPPLDLTLVELFNPRFARGVGEDNLPIDEVVTVEAGIDKLCFFVDWEGIPAEASIDGAWYLDNELQDSQAVYSGRIREQEQASGLLYWLCLETDEEVGLESGVYEVVFYVDRQVAFVEAIEVTPQPVERVEVTWKNETGLALCELAINPLAVSRQIGLNELPDGTAIPPGGEWTVALPRGDFVVEAYDCQGEPVANEFGGLRITDPVVLEIES